MRYWECIVLIVAAALFAAASIRADDELVLRSADFTYKKYTSAGTDELIYPRVHNDLLQLDIDVKTLQFFYTRASVFGESDVGQFRAVGLNYHIGLPLWKYLDIEYEHFSKHLLDATNSLPGFPSSDSLNIIIHLIPKKE